jgi:hypothetical protein
MIKLNEQGKVNCLAEWSLGLLQSKSEYNLKAELRKLKLGKEVGKLIFVIGQ